MSKCKGLRNFEFSLNPTEDILPSNKMKQNKGWDI